MDQTEENKAQGRAPIASRPQVIVHGSTPSHIVDSSSLQHHHNLYSTESASAIRPFLESNQSRTLMVENSETAWKSHVSPLCLSLSALVAQLGNPGANASQLMLATMKPITDAIQQIGPIYYGPESAVTEEEYTIPLDGDYRELCRTLMVRMLNKGLGALHEDQIQRPHEMIGELLHYPWEKAVEILLVNLLRPNPFRHQTAQTRRLDNLFRGFRVMFLRICARYWTEIVFAEAVCAALCKTQHLLIQINVQHLCFLSVVFYTLSNGFYLLAYRESRLVDGCPLGDHSEHTFMDRERVPQLLVEYVLLLMSNEGFDRAGDHYLPPEIMDCAAAVIRLLSKEYKKSDAMLHNRRMIEKMAKSILYSGLDRLVQYSKTAKKSQSFTDESWDLLMFAGEQKLGLNYFRPLSLEEAKGITVGIVKSPMTQLWDAAVGDSFVMFRLQWLNIMREKAKIRDSDGKGLRAYLLTLDPEMILEKCRHVSPTPEDDGPSDPRGLVEKVGEHPNVLARILVLYAWWLSADNENKMRKKIREHLKPVPEERIVNLMWWVFVKDAYQNTKLHSVPLETVLFTRFEDSLLPLVKENWDANESRSTDILMSWFILGIESFGMVVRHADQETHAILQQILDHRMGINIVICLLEYDRVRNPIPTYAAMKHRVVVSAFTVFFYLVKSQGLDYNLDVLKTVIRVLSETFLRQTFYQQPPHLRPKGYYGVWKMGMEILQHSAPPVLLKALQHSRPHMHFMHTRDTFISLLNKCNQTGCDLLKLPRDSEQLQPLLDAFNDAMTSMIHILEFLVLCIPQDNYLRHQLREYTIVAPICALLSMFTDKPESTGTGHKKFRPHAAFMHFPKGGRGALGGLLRAAGKFLNLIYKDFEEEEFSDKDMLEQKDMILSLALEADVVSDMISKMDMAAVGGHRY